MIDFNLKTLVILPHLDDEFALTPLIKKITKVNSKIKIIYCSERISSNYQQQRKRRCNNLKSLNLLGISLNQIIYLNDYFYVEDNRLFESSLKIYDFLKNFMNLSLYDQVFTLNFEGGHPDHDYLALIVNKLNNLFNFKAFYFPSYNARNTLGLFPYSVLRPLKSQEKFIYSIKFEKFCWFDVIYISFFYTTERFVFMLLMPFLIWKIIFSREISFFTEINITSVNWSNSLSKRRYKIEIFELLDQINKIK